MIGARRTTMPAVLCAAMCVLAACAHSQSPVLYPDAHLQRIGKERAELDVAECRALASDFVVSPAGKEMAKSTAVGAGGGAAIGAVAGAVGGGGAGLGAAIGAATGATAGLLHGAARQTGPSPVYKEFVNRCLGERGYSVIGWQ